MSEVEAPLAVPESVTHAEYIKAIEPLLTLLNLKSGWVYSPMVLDGDNIFISMVAAQEVTDYRVDRPPPWRAPVDPQAKGYAELAVNVRVKIGDQ